MSDLIKMLKAKILDVENARGPAKHILNEWLADLGQVAWDHGDEIISALKTVRGIEGLAKESESGVSITVYQNGAVVRAQRKKHGYLNKNKPSVRAANLYLAVDAAVGRARRERSDAV